MPLIEGIGDEVTLIFTILIVLVFSLLAWLSTHTSDIPFFRVVVVELTQRERNQEASRETTNEAGPAIESTDTNVSTAPTDGSRRSLSEVVSSALDNVNEALGLDRGILEDVDDDEDDDDDDGDENDESSDGDTNGETQTESSVIGTGEALAESSAIIDNNTSTSENIVSSSSSIASTGDELRKRRINFFDKNTDVKTESISSSSESHDVSSKSQTLQSNPSSNVDTNVTDTDTKPCVNATELTPETLSESSHTPDTTVNDHGNEAASESQEGQIRVRLKYLNDTQRLVFARPLDTIGVFKRTHFSEELSQQKLVRLIFNGQDLRNETSSLQSCNVVDNSVLHCLVTQNVQRETPVNYDDDDDINIGNFMIPIFGIILGALWYLRFNFKQYFNATSTLSLVGISFLFLIAAYTSIVPNNRQAQNQHLD